MFPRVYKLSFPDGNLFYVSQTGQNFEEEHLKTFKLNKSP